MKYITEGSYDIPFSYFEQYIKTAPQGAQAYINQATSAIQSKLSEIKSYLHTHVQSITFSEVIVRYKFAEKKAYYFYIRIDPSFNLTKIIPIHKDVIDLKNNSRYARDLTTLTITTQSTVQEQIFYNTLHQIHEFYDIPGHALHVTREITNPDGTKEDKLYVIHDSEHSGGKGWDNRTAQRHIGANAVDPTYIKRAFSNLTAILPKLQTLGLIIRAGIVIFESGNVKKPVVAFTFGYNYVDRIINVITTLEPRRQVSDYSYKPSDVRIVLNSNNTYDTSIKSVEDRKVPSSFKDFTNPNYKNDMGELHPTHGIVYKRPN